jgi:hypothetical protein
VSQSGLLDQMLIHTTPPRAPMLSVCTVPGCSTLTMGGTCVAHDAPVQTTFPRGRPHLAMEESELDPVAIAG